MTRNSHTTPPIITSPVFHVTAVTHRRDPIYHGVFAGVPPCETNTLWRELEEAESRGLIERTHESLRPTALGRRFLNDLVQIFLPDHNPR